MTVEITFPDYIHNAGVGGSSPPVATIFPLLFNNLTATSRNFRLANRAENFLENTGKTFTPNQKRCNAFAGSGPHSL
jgi:hypothetical protein